MPVLVRLSLTDNIKVDVWSLVAAVGSAENEQDREALFVVPMLPADVLTDNT